MTDKAYKTVVVDIETTGLNTVFDEILQLTIISEDGKVLFNKYLRPIQTNEWKEAEAVNHITYDMVKDKTTMQRELEAVQEILSAADNIIGYSTDFIIKFLRYAGVKFSPKQNAINIMETFAEIYGDYDDYFEEYTWQSLKCCADYFNYQWDGNWHNSLADCKAILYCYEKIKKGYEVNLKSYHLA